MIKIIEKWLSKIIAKNIKDLKEDLYICFSLKEDGKHLGYVEMMHKPSTGDIINNTKSDNNRYKFKIHQVELSHTGFTGVLYGEIV